MRKLMAILSLLLGSSAAWGHPTTLTLKTVYYSCSGRCKRCGVHGITALGYRSGPGVMAGDPRYIPFGSILDIPGVGRVLMVDTGGKAIRGYVADVYTRHSHRWNDDHTRHKVKATIVRWGWGKGKKR